MRLDGWWKSLRPPLGPLGRMRWYTVGAFVLWHYLATNAVPSELGTGPDWIYLGALVWAVALCPIGFFWVRERMSGTVVEAGNAAEVLRHYRLRTRVGHGLALAPLVVPLAALYIGSDAHIALWPFVYGYGISAVLIVVASPRAGDVRRLQERIDKGGGGLDLAEALMDRWQPRRRLS